MPFENHRVNRVILAQILDIVCIGAALVVASQLRVTLDIGKPLGTEGLNIETYGLVFLVHTVIFYLLSVYDPRRIFNFADEVQNLLAATSFSLLVLAGALYFSYRDVSRLLIIYFYAIDVVLLILWRVVALFIRRLIRMPGSDQPRRAIVVGAGDLGTQVISAMDRYAPADLAIVGFADDIEADEIGGHPVLGRIGEINRILEENQIDDVILALPQQDYDRVSQIVMDLQTWSVQLYIVPSFISLALYRASVNDIGGLPLISLRAPAMNAYQRLVKRMLDLVLGTAFVIGALPVMGVIALLIKLTSPGPVIFRQQRVGENGRLFNMLKFRSMSNDADARIGEILQHDESGNIIHKAPDDPRVTRIGRVLRRSSLDELPQLINVLKGDMSLVGPRPELPWLVEKYEPWQRKRFAIPQGMTGWWQINGRSNKPMHLSTEDDLYYIQNYSLLLDIKILWRTLAVVLKASGAF